MSQKSVRVLIDGKVQGVFFRTWTQQTAQRLGLTGWIKNLNDGRVEAVFQGDENKIVKVLSAVRKGSPASEVKGLKITDFKIDKFNDFVIVS